MSLTRRNLYILLTAGLVTGYLWLFYALKTGQAGQPDHTGVCLVRFVTGIPCPSCGSTRSVISLFQGHFIQALRINPLGIPVAAIMIASPFWLLFDLLTGKGTLHNAYCRFEVILQRRGLAISLMILVLINWLWNIQKGI